MDLFFESATLSFWTNAPSSQYFWNLDNNTSNQDTFQLTLNPGVYTAQLSIVDTNGCISPPNTLAASVYAAPSINYNGPVSLCGPLVNLIATATPFTQDPISQIDWIQSGQTIGTGNPFSYELPSNDGSIETFSVTVTSMLGCSNSDTFEVVFNPYPIVSFLIDPLCDGQTVNLTNQSTWAGTPINGTSIQATFLPGDGQTLANIPSSYTYNQSGSYTASLILESSAGCSDTSTQTFQLLAVPQITLSTQDTCGQVATFQALFDVPPTAVQNLEWVINNSTYNQNPLTLSFEPAGTIPYLFTLNLTNGCSYNATGSIDIIESILLEEMVFPNIISTNSNANNHRWAIDSLYENCASFELQILNRWGQMIFNTNSSQKTFEGKNENGESLSEGIYFYVFTSGDQKRQGFLHVIH